MLVLIDKYVPFLQGVLEPYATVRYLEPEAFTPDVVKEADALIVRTRTKCNAALLDGSRVQFIATATIGFDHIDRAYCEAHDIAWTNCPGCNAQAVCDYVEEALDTCLPSLEGRCLGVVGVGHVGSLVAKMAERRGMRVLLNDPPKGIGVPLEEVAAKCDVITFHTPPTKQPAAFPTYHLCDESFLQQCKPNALIINASRGGVVDEEALLRSGHACVIDTWEGEPRMNPELLAKAELASFHIAGYSLQGKENASRHCLEALCKHFGLPALTVARTDDVVHGDSAAGWLKRVTETLREHPEAFESLREQYVLR